MPLHLGLEASSSILISWSFFLLSVNFNLHSAEVLGFASLSTQPFSISETPSTFHFGRPWSHLHPYTSISKFNENVHVPGTGIGATKSNDPGYMHRGIDSEKSTKQERVGLEEGNEVDDSGGGGIYLPGKHKWLGGAVDPVDGRIYGIPSHANDVICLSPPDTAGSTEEDAIDHTNFGNQEYTMHRIPLPPSIANGKFKWLRGIIWNGFLYGIPAWSNEGVLRVDIDRYWGRRRKDEVDNIATVLPFPEGALGGNHLQNLNNNITATKNNDGEYPTRWLWHGAAMNQNQTAMYAIPSNAHHVLKINLETQTTSLIPISTTVTPLTQTNKWYGGILGDDNAIYGVPYAASGLLRIDANTDAVELIGEDEFGVRKYNWHGGVKAENGKIYCFPAHNSHVLSIDTTASISAIPMDRLSLLPIHRAPYDNDIVTRYKWLGGSIGHDGNVYGMPSDASSILRIDVRSDTVTTFGKVGREKNKYQGGTLGKDGVIYAIPSNANNILCIDTNSNVTNAIKNGGAAEIPNDHDDPGVTFLDRRAAFVIGNIEPTKDKWQGGFVGKDGSIYCIPENSDRIMKVIPNKAYSAISYI